MMKHRASGSAALTWVGLAIALAFAWAATDEDKKIKALEAESHKKVSPLGI